VFEGPVQFGLLTYLGRTGDRDRSKITIKGKKTGLVRGHPVSTPDPGPGPGPTPDSRLLIPRYVPPHRRVPIATQSVDHSVELPVPTDRPTDYLT
jgi:hypothetical protein